MARRHLGRRNDDIGGRLTANHSHRKALVSHCLDGSSRSRFAP
jgi:hypothetical protein